MIKAFKDKQPVIDQTCFIAESADIIGQVELGANTNVWYGAVIRGDSGKITVGQNTNIQDNTVIHVDYGFPTTIGNNVTIGHAAIVHGCTIHDNVLVGMGAIILDGAIIEKNVIIGAGAIVTSGKIIPTGSLVVGSPAKIIRTLTDEQIEGIKKSAEHYVDLSKESI